MKKKSSKPEKQPRKRVTAKRVQETEDLPAPIPQIHFKPQEDDDGYGPDGLKARWRLFVEAYTGPAGGSGSKAAEMAGYASENRVSLGVTACRLLRNAKIAQAIALAFAAQRITPEWTKKRLADLASADMNNFVTVDDNGVPQLDMKKAEALGAIGQIKEFDAERMKLKLHDPGPALTTLMKMFGILSDRHEFTGAGGGPLSVKLDSSLLTEDELKRLLEIHDAVALRSRATLCSSN